MRGEIATLLPGARNDLLPVCNCEERDSSLTLGNGLCNLGAIRAQYLFQNLDFHRVNEDCSWSGTAGHHKEEGAW